MPACARPVGYVPRQTHECDAAVLVRRHLAEFLGRCEERAGPLPAFVKGELEGFAGCGDFELGFVRNCCGSCGDELRVPFSCKSRGCCPSCMGRRMAEGAALLVDHVLPGGLPAVGALVPGPDGGAPGLRRGAAGRNRRAAAAGGDAGHAAPRKAAARRGLGAPRQEWPRGAVAIVSRVDTRSRPPRPACSQPRWRRSPISRGRGTA